MTSLALLQDYPSEDEENNHLAILDSSSDEEESTEKTPEPEEPARAPTSSLLSPLDAFAEITGPPDFLKKCLTETEQDEPQGKRSKQAVAATVEAKPVVLTTTTTTTNNNNIPDDDPTTEEAPTIKIQAQNPSAEDAAELLSMCARCGLPKTFTGSRGMVCPVCRDRPRIEAEVEKKRAPRVKDREKSKRMKGQSSHATWKSETEMQLRQQFD